jgi:hypothetical protein
MTMCVIALSSIDPVMLSAALSAVLVKLYRSRALHTQADDVALARAGDLEAYLAAVEIRTLCFRAQDAGVVDTVLAELVTHLPPELASWAPSEAKRLWRL